MSAVDRAVQIFAQNIVTQKLKAIVVDNVSGFLVTISAIHAQVHRGNAFAASEEIDTTGQNENFDLVLHGETGTHVHLRDYGFEVTAAPGTVHLFEAPNVEEDGTSIEPHIMRRELEDHADYETGVRVSKNNTINATGEGLEVEKVTGTKQSGGAASDDFEEWILKPGVDYLMRYNNEAQGDAEGTFQIQWYEHRHPNGFP